MLLFHLFEAERFRPGEVLILLPSIFGVYVRRFHEFNSVRKVSIHSVKIFPAVFGRVTAGFIRILTGEFIGRVKCVFLRLKEG